jgi:hypothetical protein
MTAALQTPRLRSQGVFLCLVSRSKPVLWTTLYCSQCPSSPAAQTPSVEVQFVHPLALALTIHYKKNYLGFAEKWATRILPCN